MIKILLNGVLPIFAISAIGYFMGRRGIFDASSAAIINRVIFLVAIPALGFGLIANAPFADFNWLLLIGFFFSELTIYVLGFFVFLLILKCEIQESILLGLAASFGNHLLFVLPIAVSLFGDEIVVPIIAIIALDSILLFGGTIIIMEAMSSENFSLKDLSKKIIYNPPLVSMLIGIIFAILTIKIPHGLNVFLQFVGNTAAPFSLFSLGVILSQTQISERIIPSIYVTILKLFVHPIIVWVILCVAFGLSLADSKISMLVAAAPCGTMALIIGLNYKVRTDVIAPAILFTTLGSLVSLTVVASW